MIKLCWNVFVENINRGRIEVYNIFEHGGFSKDVETIYKKYKNNFPRFCKEINRSLKYYFWSKSEWEIILSDWPPSERFKKEKIDVYDQVMLNWNIFIDYVWNETHMRKNLRTI